MRNHAYIRGMCAHVNLRRPCAIVIVNGNCFTLDTGEMPNLTMIRCLRQSARVGADPRLVDDPPAESGHRGPSHRLCRPPPTQRGQPEPTPLPRQRDQPRAT